MIFSSDNWSGASPKVMAAIAAAGTGFSPAYGDDEATRRLTERMSALFERDVAVRLVTTGTAANMLALSALSPSTGVILAHEEAHVVGDECGAVEAASGAAVLGLPGASGRLTIAALEAGLARFPAHPRFRKPAALSLTQSTEAGTLYRPAALHAIGAFARQRGLGVHMDGARFANAVAALGVAPADITWRAGVDILSFGGTKNGALMAEAVVFFNPRDLDTFDRLRQRAGQGLSKARLIAVQFLALLEDGHWLDLARHANAMAAQLSSGLVAAGARLAWPCEANAVFAILPNRVVTAMRAAGARFYDWPARGLDAGTAVEPDETLVRLVCSFATEPGDVERLVSIARQS